MEPTQSALIVPVPEAEPVVARHRERLDSAAGWGVPAHVTVLYPFLPAAELTPPIVDKVGLIVARTPAFFLRLAELSWFGDRVLWLAPDPAEPFRQLTAAIMAHFPQVRPYGGEFDDVVPHLTVGHDHPVEQLTAAGEEIRSRLPVHARADAVHLITGGPSAGRSWQTRAVLPLG